MWVREKYSLPTLPWFSQEALPVVHSLYCMGRKRLVKVLHTRLIRTDARSPVSPEVSDSNVLKFIRRDSQSLPIATGSQVVHEPTLHFVGTEQRPPSILCNFCH